MLINFFLKKPADLDFYFFKFLCHKLPFKLKMSKEHVYFQILQILDKYFFYSVLVA